LPKDGNHRLVWALFPASINDRPLYHRFLSGLFPSHGIRPWMAGLRLIVRDEAKLGQGAADLSLLPLTRKYPVDFGPAALEKALANEAENESIPDEERMQSLLALALLDYAHHRPQEALVKYQMLLGYYQMTQNVILQALVLNGMGDVYCREGTLDAAQHWYECAVPFAAKAESPLVLYIVVKNLGDLFFNQQQYDKAETCYDGADKLCEQLLDAEGKASALEWRGLSQEKQQVYENASQSWERAAQLCRATGLPDQLKANLGHLQRVYQQMRRYDRLAAIQTELRQLQPEGAAR